MCTQTICQKIQQTLILKDGKLAECSLASFHVPTLKHEAKYNLEMALSAASGNKQAAVSVYFPIHCENLQYEIKQSHQAVKMILCFCHFSKKRALWGYPILRTRQEPGEFHLLIKELLDCPDHVQV